MSLDNSGLISVLLQEEQSLSYSEDELDLYYDKHYNKFPKAIRSQSQHDSQQNSNSQKSHELKTIIDRYEVKTFNNDKNEKLFVATNKDQTIPCHSPIKRKETKAVIQNRTPELR